MEWPTSRAVGIIGGPASSPPRRSRTRSRARSSSAPPASCSRSSVTSPSPSPSRSTGAWPPRSRAAAKRSCCAICLPPRTARIAGASPMSAGAPIIAPVGTFWPRRGADGGGGAELRSIYGGVLLALGENRDLGGLNGAPLHLDIALRRARLELDGVAARRERTDPRSAARLNADDRGQRRARRRRTVPPGEGRYVADLDAAVHGRGF